MANLLKITKQTGGYFLFELTVNGEAQTPFSSIRNDLMTSGDELHFKTSNGANIIKKQNINPTDLTVIDGATYTFNTVDEVKSVLLAIDFLAWMDADGIGTGSGVSRFDDLTDAFNYFGNDGKAVVVDESQLKLKAVSFYNYNKFTQLQDTPDAIIADKILVGNAEGTGLVFESKPSVTPPSLTSVGSFHYVDLATVTTPLDVLAGVEKKITNDTLSTETNVLNAPYGISSMWDESANQLDFSQTAIGDLVTVIPAIEITTTTANQTFQIYLKTGIGSTAPLTKQIYNGSLAVAGTIVVNAARDFTIDTLDLKDYPSEIYILSNANATVKSGELDIKVVRKNINIVNVTNLTKTSEFENDGDGISPFATITDLNGKQAILTAGANITITDNVISSTGTGEAGTVTDATETVKGVLKLAGDLGGTADLPTVPALADKVDKVAGERLINAGEITKLGNQSGTNTGDQDLTGLVHTNRTALDLVSGTNTGDQDLSGKQDALVSGTNIKTINGASVLGSGDITTSSILAVVEIGTNTTLDNTHNGKVIILTASCTVTIPNGLVANFECTIVTLAGVTLTLALGGSVVLFNNAGTTMAEKLSFTLKQRLTANNYLTAGSL